jgi:hypothetical protein
MVAGPHGAVAKAEGSAPEGKFQHFSSFLSDDLFMKSQPQHHPSSFQRTIQGHSNIQNILAMLTIGNGKA